MIFNNIKFIDAGIETGGDGSTPALALKDIPSNENITDDCIYIMRKYPNMSDTLEMTSPTGLESNISGNWIINSDSSEGSNYNAFRAFDGNYNSQYGFVTKSGEGFPHWISWRNTAKKILVKSYSIRTLYNSSNTNNMNPTSWKLQGSNDGVSWVDMDSRTIEWVYGDYGIKTFNIDSNVTSYYYHRLYVTSGNNSSQLRIGELVCYSSCQYMENYYNLPVFGSSKSNITKIAFIGCPEQGEMFYEDIGDSNVSMLESAGWLNSGYKYASVLGATANSVNFYTSSMLRFYFHNINLLRLAENTDFNISQSSGNSRWLFYNSCDMDIVDIRNCRFSALGINLDDESYIERTPKMKCCAYMGFYCGINRFTFQNNVVNYIPHTQGADASAYDGFCITGYMNSAIISKNEFYMTSTNPTTKRSGTTGDNAPFGRYCFSIGNYYSPNNGSYKFSSNFIAFNYNKLTIRICDYTDLEGWLYCPYVEKFEFIGNRISQGASMSDYDYTRINAYLYKQNIVNVCNDNASCYDYCIKDFKVNLPYIWTGYSSNLVSFNFFNDSCANHVFTKPGFNRGNKTRIVEDIEIILGEGPDIDSINSEDAQYINAWGSTSFRAIFFSGGITWNSYTYYFDSKNGDVMKNIKVIAPWSSAYIRCTYAEFSSLRGALFMSTASTAIIENMSVKIGRGDTIKVDSQNAIARIKNLLVEDTSRTYYMSFNTNCFFNTIIIDKCNYPLYQNNNTWDANGNNNANDDYNECLVVHNDVGEDHKFLARSLNKYIESCSVKRGNNNTLKMFGVYNNDRPLRIESTGDSGISSRNVEKGRYKARINMSFYGDDLVEHTITTPDNTNMNVLNLNSLLFGIKTKWGIYNCPDSVVSSVDNSWNSDLVNPFYHEFYIDIYEDSDIYLILEKFNVYSSGFRFNNPTSAVFVDPLIELVRIGDTEESNSCSDSISASNA